MKRFKTPIILACTLAVLSLVAYWDEWQTHQDAAEEAAKNKVLSFNLDDVIALSFVGDSQSEAVQLSRVESRWQIVSPVVSEAEVQTIESLLQTLAEYKYESVVTSDKKRWHEFGLENPLRSIELTQKDGAKVSLFIGEKAPVGYSAYVRTGTSDEVYLGSQHIIMSTAKTLRDFRKKSFVNMVASQVEKLSYLVGGDVIVRIFKDGDEGYKLEYPSGIKENPSAISGFLSDVAELKALSFRDDIDQALNDKFNNATAKISIKWQDGEGGKVRLDVAGIGAKFWARLNNGPTLFEISSEAMKSLTRTLIDFRDRQLADIEVGDIEQVRLNGILYQRKGADFYQEGVEGEEAKKLHIQNLVADLAWAKISRFLGKEMPKEFAGKKPDIIIELADSGQQLGQGVVITAWRDSDTTFLVQSNQVADFVSVEQSVFSNIEDSFEPSELNDLPEDAEPASEESEFPRLEERAMTPLEDDQG